MVDLSAEEFLFLARTARVPIPQEDVEPLTLRFNALMDSLEVLDQYPLEQVMALPGLPHPQELPSRDRSGAAPELNVETDAPLAYKPITELAALIRSRQISAVELTDLYLERIGRFDGDLKSYITVTPEVARAEARESEGRWAAGEQRGMLDGIPLAYKDEYYTKGIRTTCGSMILSEFVPDFDATAIAKLREAGVTMLGKLNMTEWATPLTLEFPFGHPRNPWNLNHDAGGSSTGSGSATAAALCAAALGEDTGGSIRRPASHDSCVGLRPSWGRVSMYGVIPALWTQDTAGPLTRTVADCALLMNAIAGSDVNDPLAAHLPVPDYLAVLGRDLRGLRVGVVTEMLEGDHIHPEVQARVREAIGRFEGLGARVEEVSLPLVKLSNIIAGATGSDRTALQWVNLRNHPDQYDAASRRFNLLPGVVPASLYQRVLQLRSLLRRQVLEACDRFDILLSPCQPTPPPTIEDTRKPLATKAEALAELGRYSLSTPAAIAGIPAISLPCGFSQEGLPIGLQIMAKRYDEETVFQAAHAYEQDTAWHTMRPPFGEG